MVTSSLQDAAALASEHKCCLHRPFSHLSPTSSTTMSLPCPPPSPFHFCRKENQEVAAYNELPTRCQDMEGLDRPSPESTQGDEAPNVLVLPGLRLLQQEVEDVQVSHAVCDEEDSALVLIVHFPDECLRVVEVFRLLLCGQGRHQLLATSLMATGLQGWP